MMEEVMEKPAPTLSDHDSAGFFEAAARGELVVKKCRDCGAIVHLPIAVCDNCHSWNTEWQPVGLSGTLYSYTRVTRQMHPAFPVPYVIVLVSVDDAPAARYAGRIDGDPALEIGMPMTAYFEQRGDSTIVNWAIAKT